MQEKPTNRAMNNIDAHIAKYILKNASMSTWTVLILSRSLRVNIGILHLPINFNVS